MKPWYDYNGELVCGECAKGGMFTDADREEMVEQHPDTLVNARCARCDRERGKADVNALIYAKHSVVFAINRTRYESVTTRDKAMAKSMKSIHDELMYALANIQSVLDWIEAPEFAAGETEESIPAATSRAD